MVVALVLFVEVCLSPKDVLHFDDFAWPLRVEMFGFVHRYGDQQFDKYTTRMWLNYRGGICGNPIVRIGFTRR